MEMLNREIENALKTPFGVEDIEWRIQSSGVKDKPWALVLAYVAARAIQERLDSVVGIENWTATYEHIQNGVICNLSLRINGEWITKQDGSPETEIESFKGGISKAFVRTASAGWGIGRYLYGLDTGWAIFSENGKYRDKIKDNYYKWNPPDLPAWALPERIPIKKQKPSSETILLNPDDPRTIPVKPEVSPTVSDKEKAEFLIKVKNLAKKCPPDDWEKLIADFGGPEEKKEPEKADMFLKQLKMYIDNFKKLTNQQNDDLPF